MIEYDFICDLCSDRLTTESFEDDGEIHGMVDKGKNCNGHLQRVWSFGIGSVSNAGGTPGRPSI